MNGPDARPVAYDPADATVYIVAFIGFVAGMFMIVSGVLDWLSADSFFHTSTGMLASWTDLPSSGTRPYQCTDGSQVTSISWQIRRAVVILAFAGLVITTALTLLVAVLDSLVYGWKGVDDAFAVGLLVCMAIIFFATVLAIFLGARLDSECWNQAMGSR